MKGRFRFHIGLRMIKTAAAVIISMLIVSALGITDSSMIFAMLGAMAAVQTTFKESVISSLTQIVGVLFGALLGMGLRLIPIPDLVLAGVGLIMVLALYHAFGVQFSPGLPCMIVVMLCVSPDIRPVEYAVGRIWDTAIGLAVGMLINTLVFPYDNSRKIRDTAKSLDKELIRFLEELFDGDQVLPNAASMVEKVEEMRHQLKIFENQKLILRKKNQKREIEDFRVCERMARELVARMEVLCHIEKPGCLNEENRQKLEQVGAQIRDNRRLDVATELDVVTNYHVAQILTIRQQLLETLK